jgi:hypothetical protein
MRFFVGLHHPSDAGEFAACFISVKRIENRKSPFLVNDWVMDSGAFSTIKTHGGYPNPPKQYAEQIKRWAGNGNLLAAVTQDYMCEPGMLKRTGFPLKFHQRLTTDRYDSLLQHDLGGCYLMPVLQGWMPDDYKRHLEMYGDRLKTGAWVGAGSVCKRTTAESISKVLLAIKSMRPDLRLHGFGATLNAFESPLVTSLLETADSMAWSFAGRMSKEKNGANNKANAHKFVAKIENIFAQRIEMNQRQFGIFTQHG